MHSRGPPQIHNGQGWNESGNNQGIESRERCQFPNNWGGGRPPLLGDCPSLPPNQPHWNLGLNANNQEENRLQWGQQGGSYSSEWARQTESSTLPSSTIPHQSSSINHRFSAPSSLHINHKPSIASDKSSRSFVPNPNNAREIYEWAHSLQSNSNSHCPISSTQSSPNSSMHCRSQSDIRQSEMESDRSDFRTSANNTSSKSESEKHEHNSSSEKERNESLSTTKYNDNRCRRETFRNYSSNGDRNRDRNEVTRIARGRSRDSTESVRNTRERSREQSENIRINRERSRDRSESIHSARERSRDRNESIHNTRDKSRDRIDPDRNSLIVSRDRNASANRIPCDRGWDRTESVRISRDRNRGEPTRNIRDRNITRAHRDPRDSEKRRSLSTDRGRARARNGSGSLSPVRKKIVHKSEVRNSTKEVSLRRDDRESSVKSRYARSENEVRNSRPVDRKRDHPSTSTTRYESRDDGRKRPTTYSHYSNSSKRRRERDNFKTEIDSDQDVVIPKDDQDTDVLEEIGAVEKWVRSAPDELYYERLTIGEVKAKERTNILCEKFETNLVLRAKTSRLEAESLGNSKMSELIETENLELIAQKKCRAVRREKGKSKDKQTQEKAPEVQVQQIILSIMDKKLELVKVNQTPPIEITVSDNLLYVACTATAVAQNSETEIAKLELNELEEGEVELSDQQDSYSPLSAVASNNHWGNKNGVPKDDGSMLGEAITSDEEFLDNDQPLEKESITDKYQCPENSSKNPIKCNHETNHTDDKKCGRDKSDLESQSESSKKSKPDTTKKLYKKKKQTSTKKSKSCSSSSESSSCDSGSESNEVESESDDSSDDDGMSRSDTANRELERRKKHPRRLHVELWHNDPGLMNDGPVCRCSAKARRYGIRHGYYPGESKIPLCDPLSNNSKVLHHYRITISPPKNFLINTPTVINHDGHEYIFEGFSIFSHYPLDLNLPPCKVIRFNIRYDVFVEEEKFPDSFCVKELMLFETYIFREILELVDLRYDWKEEGSCPQFHLMPRFVRQLPDNGKEILSMSRVLTHLLKNDKELVKEEDLHRLYTVEQSEWQNFADQHKGMIVTKWGMKPSSIRVDQIDRDVSGQEQAEDDGIPFPLIVHFGIRPPQLSYAGNAGYQRAWRRYVKYRHLLSNMPKPSAEDKRKLLVKELRLQEMRTASTMKRDVTVAISSKGFRTTGICCDLVQHAMLIPVLVAHLRFHKGLAKLETKMEYQFKNRYLLQLAMTHPSYRENFGTNPDHARNALTNCGIRQPEYGDRRIHYASTRKRGINTLINIMARFGADEETESEITHNERLEFLGDAVVEFVTSIHLFHIFPDLEEGGLATYRAAIVQNQHLAVLAQTLELDQFMLYAHGSDLCHDSELRHAMANCFEALMGALFLDGGLEVWKQILVADRVFGNTLFGEELGLRPIWTKYPKHPLQLQEPTGDRHWIESHSVLKRLTEFEDTIGVEFTHIRLLARAFTDRSLGYNNLSRGSNQRLEFLGDTVLQLISSEYLYRHFPDHHEGHLSLLRSSLVNNRTQSLVCDDLGMTKYAMRGDPKSEMKTKDRADLLEAFLGALYIDKGLKYCVVFCSVCFFPRLNKSIIKQEWNDPKSKLQQCCLTLRAMDGREPDIPVYKVTESLGPTNTRVYIVAVYFRSKRLATAQGHSIQEAEMNAAALALQLSGHLFPQLHHQKRVMDKTNKKFR